MRAVRQLHDTMHTRRVGRLRQLGFDDATANEIAELHTANFMESYRWCPTWAMRMTDPHERWAAVGCSLP
jgi:hypothetical protein